MSARQQHLIAGWGSARHACALQPCATAPLPVIAAGRPRKPSSKKQLECRRAFPERDQQLADELYKSITRHGINLTPEQFKERFDMLQQVTEAGDAKQRAALVHRLRRWPDPLELLPTTVQGKAVALKQQLLQQLGVDEEQTQQLIGKVPTVLMYKADLLVDKASEQGPLLDIKAADVVVQLWTHNHHLVTASTQLLHKKLVRLQQ